MIKMEKSDKIFVAGTDNYIGKAIKQKLLEHGYASVVDGGPTGIDLSDSRAVDEFFTVESPNYVFLVAGESGGIAANMNFPAQLMQNNLQINSNVIGSAHRNRVTKLLYLASSCVYPAQSPQPIKEEYLLSGPLEPTNEAYALAKIAGIKLCQAFSEQYGANFICAIPTNIYGPDDDFSPEESHVIPGLLSRMHAAKTASAETVDVWGTGKVRREFIYVDDLAEGCIFLMQQDGGQSPVNIGSGQAVSIAELAGMIKTVVGYPGGISYDTTRPDGMPLKVLDSGVASRLGWQAATSLESGLAKTYSWYLNRTRALQPRA